MLHKKKKLSRKEIKEDKLVTTYYKAYNFFEENKQRLLMYVGAAALIILAVIFYINNKENRNREASVFLSRAMELYDTGSYLEAIEGKQGTEVRGLKYIADEYDGTENGETAKIYLANCYNFLGKLDEALEYYKDYSGDSEIFKAAALAGQAGIYASKNENEKAADLYKEAAFISQNNILNPEYLLNAGINYLKIGDKEEAKELFDIIKDDYKASTAFSEVDKYIAQVQ